ncbi:BREX system P-loop protein BrxC [Endozoicomonas gorgoniicola]|uniref:BREX system P-loop protein BrxC n=1 Tax=Endozoicomonas gorgoniicola TaxID=1234144 RepID=A0ABT3MU26_9GAMM|nr:BREX system P-loop protein BrxC [Endozoicomonas gorgoniicola]MCW7552863.1 BREX system P-loop protein BrxC [Endozoicomonas gorgoniicola]
MVIKKLFKEDIERKINDVVKADKTEDATVWQELHEYVVTTEIVKELDRFFQNFIPSLDNPKLAENENGVWITGFFGSGKSHLLKIISYLLGNAEITHEGQTKRPWEFFETKPRCLDNPFLVMDNIKRMGQASGNVVLFNIDSKSDAKKGKDALLKVFVNVFNDKVCGYSGDFPHIAAIERQLEQQGLYQAFQDEFARITGGESWKDKRKGYRFKSKQASQALANVLEQDKDIMEHWLNNRDNSFAMTPEKFAEDVRDYLDSKGPDERIYFLVDEISQFVGSDSDLMLNLQTVVENLGTYCGGRAWVMVTAQEDMSAVIGALKDKEDKDFSKIQGRFATRMSLGSTRTDEVIQHRLLEKEAEPENELKQIFNDKGDILRHQLSFTDAKMTLKNYQGEIEFTAHYPFVPYQYGLVQKIFERLRDVKMTGGQTSRGERSLIGAFQRAAQSVKDESVGVLMPLWRFYSAIENTLNTIVTTTVSSADDVLKEDPFDTQLLRTLFLIRYVDEIPGTINNLISLSIDEIDADLVVLRRKIEQSLQRLEKETLISRTGNEYFFLTNEERDIANEIKGIKLDDGEINKRLASLLFSEILSDNNRYMYKANGKIFEYNRICDGHYEGSAKDRPLTIQVVSPLFEDYGLWSDAGRCRVHSMEAVLLRLPNNERLFDDMMKSLQTRSYLGRDHSNSKPSTKMVRDRLQADLAEQEKVLRESLEEMMSQATCYAAEKELSLKQSRPKEILEEAFTYFIQNRFNKLSYLDTLSPNNDTAKEIRDTLRRDPTGADQLALGATGEANEKALQEIRNRLKNREIRKERTVLKQEIENFAGLPYGWPEMETALLFARLVHVGEIEILKGTEPATHEQLENLLVKTSQWQYLEVRKCKRVDEKVLKNARKLAMDLFEEKLKASEKELFDDIRRLLTGWKSQLKSWRLLANEGNPGGQIIDGSLVVVEPLLDIKETIRFFEVFNDNESELLDTSDHIHDLHNFYKSQKTGWDSLKALLKKVEPNKEHILNDDSAAKALQALKEIREDDKPFKRLKTVPALITTVDEFNLTLVERERNTALDKVDTLIAAMEQQLDTADADAILRNKCLYGLQQQRRTIEQQTSVAHMQYASTKGADDLFQESLDKLEQEQEKQRKTEEEAQKRAEEEARRKAEQEGKPAPKPVPAKPKPVVRLKPSQEVTVSQLLKPGQFLEDQAAVDDFLKTLRTELETALTNGKRIRIR